MISDLAFFEPDSLIRDKTIKYLSEYFTIYTLRSEKACLEFIDSHRRIFFLCTLDGKQGKKISFLKNLFEDYPELRKIVITPEKNKKFLLFQESFSIPEPEFFRFGSVIIKKLMDDEFVKNPVAFPQNGSLPVIIGSHPLLMDQLKQARRIADFSECAFITGETGTGKELIARYIHYLGTRRNGPFHAVNCAAINHTLFESEFFGHKKGAYTGATENRLGHFMKAHKGTLVLDEITEIDLASQAKLLRVIENQEMYAVGSQKLEKTDVRILAISNRNIQDLIRSGRFRQDLFYRLNILPVRLPALRERNSDIEPLARYFIRTFQVKYDILPNPKMENTTISFLKRKHFAGNVRELQNLIFKILASGYLESKRLTINDLENVYRQYHSTSQLRADTMGQNKSAIDKAGYIALLKRHNCNISHAARDIGISRQNMQYRLKKMKIKKWEIR